MIRIDDVGRKLRIDAIGSRSFGRVRITILGFWLISVIGLRWLLSLFLSDLWLGTVGAIGITFAIFFIALKFTPFRKYRLTVNAVLQDWYSRKFVLYSLFGTAAVLLTIIVLVEYGYAFHSDKIVALSELSTMDSAQRQVDESVRTLRLQGYSLLDALTIITASVDKSLEGYYLKSTTFVFAENVEVIAFVLLTRRFQRIFQ